MLQFRPAAKMCCALIAGIIFGSRWTGATSFILLSITFLASVACVAGFRLAPARPAFLILLLVLFGMAKIQFDETSRDNESVRRFVRITHPVRLRGTVADLPHTDAYSLKFVVEAESLEVNARAVGVSGGVVVSLKRSDCSGVPVESLRYGTEVSLLGSLRTPGSARNPGEFDLEAYYRLNDIDARMALSGAKDIEITGRKSTTMLARYVVPVRESISASIDSLFKGEEGNFLKGLLVGERSDIPQEVKASFINAGVMHILAVSGLHVAIVVMIVFALLRVLRVPPNVRLVLTMGILVYYNFLTGGAASVTRSVIMGIVFLGGKLFEIRTDIYNTLAVSAIIILLADARQLFQPGFQLSFAAVFSLVYLYPKLHRLGAYLPDRIARIGAVQLVVSSLAVSIAAGVGTLPVGALYFEKISVISFLANLVIVPLSNVILGLGMVTIAVSYCSSWSAFIFAQTVHASTGLLLELVQLFGRLPFAYVETHFTIIDACWYYYGMFCLVYVGNRTARCWNIIAFCTGANIILYGGLIFPSKEKLRATFLDVGQGDAIVISFADRATMLIDAGPRSMTMDAGWRFVVPFLKRSGIDSLSTLLLTHPHSDHLGGMAAVLRTLPMRRIVDAGSAGSGPLFSEYESLIDSLQIEHDTLRAGMQIAIDAGMRIQCLSPIKDARRGEVREGANLNNESVIIKILYGATSLLLVGDAEKEEEHEVISRYGGYLRSDVLKAGHHGSSTSSSEAFVETVSPREVVISVGTKNKFHHPSPTVVRRYLDLGCIVHQTDESGAAIFESDGTTWKKINWH